MYNRTEKIVFLLHSVWTFYFFLRERKNATVFCVIFPFAGVKVLKIHQTLTHFFEEAQSLNADWDSGIFSYYLILIQDTHLLTSH